MSTTIQVSLFLALILCVGACSDYKKVANNLDTYAQRLQSYTGIALVDREFSYFLNAPLKPDLKQSVAEITINLRDLYALNDCALSQLIALRNTALGKMQLPSTRYAYESELLFELSICEQAHQHDQNQLPLLEKLTLWKAQKQQLLPIVWANLITQSNEVYSHLTRAPDFISGNDKDNFQATRLALQFLLRAKSEHPVDISELELHLQQLSDTPLLARKWRTQLLLSQKLDQISLLLTEYLANKQCRTNQDRESIKIMQNIFRKLFAQTIQPLAAELNKYHYQLSPLIEQFAYSTDFKESFRAYLTRHNEVNYQLYTRSMQNHISLWQDIFALCD